jgi:hypothetical protein
MTTTSSPITITVGRDKTLMVYPNPVRHKATIEFSMPVKSYVELKLYSSQGVQVNTLFSGLIESNEVKKIQLNTGGLTNGIYLCRLIYNDGSSYFENWLESKIVILK